MKLTKFVGALLILLTAGSGLAPAQTWDTSGNSLLKGNYYFRQVIWLVGYDTGQLTEATAVYGTLTFSGSGTYTGTVSVLDSSEGSESGAISGTYSIAASGYGFISSPLVTGDDIFGLVNQAGIFVASTTETTNGYNDMFIGVPLSPVPTAATFKGTYSIAGIDLSSGTPGTTINYMWTVSPDGVKNLGASSLTAYVGQEGATKYTQNIASVTYAASNGAMVFTLPTTTTSFLAGLKFMYISPDGNFLVGGNPEGFDMFVGVRNGSGSTALSGLYYQAGLDEPVSGQDGYLDTYYGSLSVNGSSSVATARIASPFNANAFDCTYSSGYPAACYGIYTPSMSYVVGQGGERIGSGIGPNLGINVAIPAPTFTGSGPYLNPTGVVNAASSAPFTAGIAPGELLTLYGTNLADALVVTPGIPFQPMLGNVQVMINGTAAPIYYVSPTQVSAIVPYEVTGAIADVQVITDGNPSNTVTEFVNETSVGIFSVPPGGLGYGAVLHQSGALVTPANPAQIGEIVSVYLTGLGAVTPTIADGAAGTVGATTNTIVADISGTTATVGYAGLAPTLAGLYQVNLTIPSGLTNGDNYLDIGGPDSYTAEVLISIGGSTSTSVASAASVRRATPHIAKANTPLGKRMSR